MTMVFKYVPVDTLPPLAWCARVRAGSLVATIFHGKNVETAEDFFAEAAWDGRFTGSGLRAATVVCGSGGTCDSGRFTFHASTDRSSPLFSLRKSGVTYISNSAAFVLTAAGERPDPLHPFYYHGLVGIDRGGLRGVDGSLPTASPGVKLGVHFYVALGIGPDLAVTFDISAAGEEPRTWEDYRLLVDRRVRDVVANACDSSRRLPYRLLAQISRGYDSVATAALAAAAGCQEAVTIHDSRADDPARDCGKDIASALGMNCGVIDRWDYLRSDDLVEAEFALPTISVVPAWSSFESNLAGRLVVTGSHGDTVWELHPKLSLSPELESPRKTKIIGLSELEFRLRTGYLLLVPAAIGMRHSQAIAAISRSPEMQRWSVGGSYDRPIARRFAEDCGVPRASFGMKKIVGGCAQFKRSDDFSPAGLRAYDEFRTSSHAAETASRRLAARLLCAGEQAAWHCLNEGRRRSAIASRLPWQPVALTGPRHTVPWRFRFLFQWSCESLAVRYQLPHVEESGA
jgi:hypothetical protein